MRHLLVTAFLACAARASGAAELTDTELRWLTAGWPVVAYAKELKLPLEIVVQPQSEAGSAPLAMGYDRGRCLLVLSIRRNPDADAVFEGVDAALVPAIAEAMFAHELGHCWRYVHGKWHTLPADLYEFADVEGGSKLADARRSMRDTRREEAYADVVALAWTRSRHPGRYAQVHAWLTAYRAEPGADGAHHDTRAWIRLARDSRVFGPAATPFQQAEPVWRDGLLSVGLGRAAKADRE
jgi:hypothetical protein